MLKVAAEFRDAQAKADVLKIVKYYGEGESIGELIVVLTFQHKTKWQEFCKWLFEKEMPIAMTLEFS